MIRIYTDAAVKGNPGPVGIGIVIVRNNEQTQHSFPFDEQLNNHQAEFQAVIQGMKWLIKNDWTDELTFCYTDSQIVAQSVEKKYVKDMSSKKYLDDILKLMEEFPYANVTWIPESENRGADNLAKQALQKTIQEQG